MLGYIALIATKHLELHLARIFQKAPAKKGDHRFRHTANVVVLTQKRDELAREAAYKLGVPRIKKLTKRTVPRCDKELAET